MKKLLLILSILAFAFSVSAQQSFNFTATSGGDSLVGATIKYFYLANPVTTRWNGTVEVYITPSLSSSDSTHVWLEASMNNSTWYTVTNFAAPNTAGGASYYSSATATYAYKGKMGTTASGWLWSPQWFLNAPYYRVAVQHFKAATSVKVTRAKIYLKK